MRAIGNAIAYALRSYIDGNTFLADIIRLVERDVYEKGLDVLAGIPYPGDMVYFRPQELSAALNRLRTLRVA